MPNNTFLHLQDVLENSFEISGNTITISKPDKFKENIYKAVKLAVAGEQEVNIFARYIIRAGAIQLGAIPASIHDLYVARGKGEVPNSFTVPAINLRILPFHAAKAVFNILNTIEGSAVIFEIARSEIGYTDQRPSEYISNILGAAIATGFVGPVFVQGDHFQISVGRFETDPDLEVQTIKDLSKEAVDAGFYNIDVDTSTLVDLSTDDVATQQILNTKLSAEISAFIRQVEPQEVTVSIGGEIGEVGGHNSTVEELRAYMDGYNAKLKEINPEYVGLSKISIQTGTSHGGVVLEDGTIAEAKVDFDTLLNLSKISREDYQMGGAVQHGASTLPQNAFSKFVDAEAVEVHLATNFQNIFFNHCPDELLSKMYAYLDENHAHERKADMTDEQFYYKTRKRVIGIFKDEIWALPESKKEFVTQKWEEQFKQLFDSLAVANTKQYVDQYIKPAKIFPDLDIYKKLIGEKKEQEDTSDLAD